ncbi:DUF2190 family protein [Sinorhizobium sp. BG8]|uniref:DUF2190 family protein n=1 Tax=Sinorhizobium sp. BG8 TaxID=2613773 RepID=UPI00193D5929|nr:DUF2190 family protein [Sinorhizobium sp. BG8]QRM55142.1 DUF2190 family protein [Sinorhizobium sp. BG8]
MKNFTQPGDVLDVPAPSGGVVSGKPVIIGSLIGIAALTAAEGVTFPLQRTGVHTLAKTSAQAWTVGAKIYWTGTEATTTSSGNTLIGIAAEAAANPSSTGKVLLGPTTV